MNAAEMAQLAARLGRQFDSRKWALIGSLPAPSAAGDDQEPHLAASKTLADVLPEIAMATSVGASEPGKPARPPPRFSDDAETCGASFRPGERLDMRPADPTGHSQRRSWAHRH